MEFAVKLRYFLKFTMAALWVVLLPVTYAYTWENPTGIIRAIKSWFGNGQNHPPLFVISVVMYLSPSMLSAILFLLPFLRRKLESSDFKLVRLIMWWSQVNLKFLNCRNYHLIPNYHFTFMCQILYYLDTNLRIQIVFFLSIQWYLLSCMLERKYYISWPFKKVKVSFSLFCQSKWCIL